MENRTVVPDWCEEENVSESRRAIKEKSKMDSRENSSSRKKVRLNTNNDTEDSKKPLRKELVLEADPLVLQRRQKQIDYGKNTVGYHCYVKQVPLEKRTKDDPRTPDKFLKYSRRSWDMLIKMWRKKLHQYDTEASEENNTEASKANDTEDIKAPTVESDESSSDSFEF